MTTPPIRPPEAPLDMPEQALKGKGQSQCGASRSHYWRKWLISLSSLVLIGYLGWLMFRVLNVSGMTGLEWSLLFLFLVNIGWIGFAFCSAVAGFLVTLLASRHGVRSPEDNGLSTRTAILFPVYNESVEDVFATVKATASALASRAPGHFECFILSDSTNPDVALMEEAAIERLQAEMPEACPIYYRRRTINIARKSGNIHDFVSRWGARYDFMLIFDADSYMDADTLIELAKRMEENPETGLIQTVPRLIGGESLFARSQQFAASVYGPLLGRGISWWAQDEGNYWGHNAIIRLRAFAEAAGLPVMPGRAPFGGHILSHDFVEAALLRRAGWKVVIAPDLVGSYEEGPPTIIDLTIRDRRWCQGNLQHSAVLARAHGLTFTNRLHFMVGIMSYLASPLWLVLILVGMALSLQNRFFRPDYFTDNPSLVPNWPVIDPVLALNVFLATMAILLLPKLFGVIASIIRPAGGVRLSALQLFFGSLLETLISALVAPILMAAQTSSVISILTGQDTGWAPQKRDSDGYDIASVARRHAFTTILGILLTLSALVISTVFAAWLAPATFGMVFSIPLSWWLGRKVADTSVVARLLNTPETARQPESFIHAIANRDALFDLEPVSLVDLISRPEHLTARNRIPDGHWPLSESDVHVPLAVASAKLQKSGDLPTILSRLTPAEKMALINSPELIRQTGDRLSDEGGQTRKTAELAL